MDTYIFRVFDIRASMVYNAYITRKQQTPKRRNTKMKKRIISLIAAAASVLALTAALASCGGDSNTGTETTAGGSRFLTTLRTRLVHFSFSSRRASSSSARAQASPQRFPTSLRIRKTSPSVRLRQLSFLTSSAMFHSQLSTPTTLSPQISRPQRIRSLSRAPTPHTPTSLRLRRAMRAPI